MAITTLAAARAGRERTDHVFIKSWSNNEAGGTFASFLNIGNHPAAAATPAPGLAGAALTTYSGGLLGFRNPASGNKYLHSIEYDCSTTDNLVIFDRLWHNSGIAIGTTTAQTVNSVAFPNRDRKQAANGEGCWVFLEVWGADTTNAGVITTITISYTNEAGVAGRTGTLYDWPATARNGTMMPFALQAGDYGVRSIQSITLGTAITGTATVHLSLCRPIVWLTHNLSASTAPTREDIVSMVAPRLFTDSVPFLVSFPTGSSTGLRGHISYTEG